MMDMATSHQVWCPSVVNLNFASEAEETFLGLKLCPTFVTLRDLSICSLRFFEA